MIFGLYHFTAVHRDFSLHLLLKEGWKTLKILGIITNIRQV